MAPLFVVRRLHFVFAICLNTILSHRVLFCLLNKYKHPIVQIIGVDSTVFFIKGFSFSTYLHTEKVVYKSVNHSLIISIL